MKKKNIILTVVVVVCVGLLAVAVYLFNDIFPKAKPIRRPEIEDVVSVSLNCNTLDASIPLNELHIEDLLLYISEARPTRKQSLNDYPTSGAYYGVEIQTGDKEYRYYVYEEGEQVYIEMPYEGIYTSEIELLNLVLTYFVPSSAILQLRY